MKKWIFVIITHVLGALTISIKDLYFHTFLFNLPCQGLLVKILQSPHKNTISDFFTICVYLIVGISTVKFINAKKDKFYILKCISAFVGSCCILFILFRIIIVSIWVISIATWGF